MAPRALYPVFAIVAAAYVSQAMVRASLLLPHAILAIDKAPAQNGLIGYVPFITRTPPYIS